MVQGGDTALMSAAYGGHDGCVDLLVKAGAKLDVQTPVGGHEWTCRIQDPPTDSLRSHPSHSTPMPLRPSSHTVIDLTSVAPHVHSWCRMAARRS